ncbi:PrsW family intramembrane metalloprotease [Chordicoccus furentiruminis]|uniref:PrsW family intramembrane metalloprotease n=1 Tax=Chordicoccus furentiruminis TaxID=2709410 RepID=UPI0023A8D5ED|nr:PrsW family intramembrane metalloprotease [Chordicoccus furentiruminis]
MMFFLMPIGWILFIYISAAVIPAVFLMRYIYQMDTVEKEPPELLWSLAGQGVIAALISIVLEMIGEAILNHSKISSGSPTYVILLAFLVVAAAEEGSKYVLLYRRTWNDPNFNYRFDGVVYAAFVSLGFAAFENVKYVFDYGLTVAFPRAILSIPGHLGFAVVFGCFYGRARLCADRGERGRSAVNLAAGYLLAVFLHGFYDSCAMIGTGLSTVVFVLFVAVMYIVVFQLLRHESRTDEPV